MKKLITAVVINSLVFTSVVYAGQEVIKKNIKENDKVYIHLPKNKIWGMNG